MPQTATWMSVADHLPDGNETVIIHNVRWSESLGVWLGYHDGAAWYSADGALLNDDEGCESEDLLPPTHWMPMPEPPTGKGTEDAEPVPFLKKDRHDDEHRASEWRVGTSRLVDTKEMGVMLGLFADAACEQPLGLLWVAWYEARLIGKQLRDASDLAVARGCLSEADGKEGA